MCRPLAAAPHAFFQNLPSDWRCPTCGAEKKLFVSKAKVVAGFSQNQGTCFLRRCCFHQERALTAPPGYGMGANSMTAEQKSLLIYGTLGTFFALFLAGYFLD